VNAAYARPDGPRSGPAAVSPVHVTALGQPALRTVDLRSRATSGIHPGRTASRIGPVDGSRQACPATSKSTQEG
jgi:hypothetical protein